MSNEHSTEEARVAEAICVCTSNHDPDNRIECRYAANAAQRVVSAGWGPDAEHRLALLRSVLSYVDAHAEADLPLTLLESIRLAVANAGDGA